MKDVEDPIGNEVIQLKSECIEPHMGTERQQNILGWHFNTFHWDRQTFIFGFN